MYKQLMIGAHSLRDVARDEFEIGQHYLQVGRK